MFTKILLIVAAISGGGFSAAGAQTIDVGRGQVQLRVPVSQATGSEMALIVLLHGYSHTGSLRESGWKFGELVDEYQFVLAYPDGTREASGDRNQFWNASDACCNFMGSKVDDSAYLLKLIERIRTTYKIDSQRIFLVGHSNGGFMSYRFAYDHSDIVAAIVSVAGAATVMDQPSPLHAVHVLQVHGTADSVIDYKGGEIRAGGPDGRSYPGAVESAERWADYNGCALDSTSGPELDLDKGVRGNETTVIQYTDGCNEGGSSEVWTINGGGHTPDISSDFTRNIVEWFLAHPKKQKTF